MNETKLIDFDASTLSKVSQLVLKEIKVLNKYPIGPDNTTQQREAIENLLEFHVQVLYAFSVAIRREKIANS